MSNFDRVTSDVLVSRPPNQQQLHADPTDHASVAASVAASSPAGLRDALDPPQGGRATAGYRSAKYTPTEWHSHNDATLRRAAADAAAAERIQRLSQSMCRKSEADVQRRQAEGTRRLGGRLQETHVMKSELREHVERLRAETDSLVRLKARLEKALDATEVPYGIATDNFTCRERRLGPELVQDAVEDELLKVQIKSNVVNPYIHIAIDIYT